MPRKDSSSGLDDKDIKALVTRIISNIPEVNIPEVTESVGKKTGEVSLAQAKQETETFGEKKEILQLEDIKTSIKLRRKYGEQVFSLVKNWMIFTGIMVFLSGLRFVPHSKEYFFLSDSVLWVLLGTSTFNVIGMATAIISGLFPKETIHKNDD